MTVWPLPNKVGLNREYTDPLLKYRALSRASNYGRMFDGERIILTRNFVSRSPKPTIKSLVGPMIAQIHYSPPNDTDGQTVVFGP
jgi:hypothetical protein